MAADEQTLTEDQAAVYDRQLRVWGVDVQRRLSSGRVLLVGFGQLAAEVAKNITLAGVGRVTLLDDTPASHHAGRSFLVPSCTSATGANEQESVAAVAAASLQAMNPLVLVNAASGAACARDAAPLLQTHDLVVACGLRLHELCEINRLCREAGVALLAGAVAGPSGWLFADLGAEHAFTPKGETQRILQYAPLVDALAPPSSPLPRGTHGLTRVLLALVTAERQLGRPVAAAEDLQIVTAALDALPCEPCPPGTRDAQAELARSLLPSWALTPAPELAPVAAVLGGIAANSALAALSHAAAPLHNMLLFSLHDGRAIVEMRGVSVGAGSTGSKAAGAAAAGEVPEAAAAAVAVAAAAEAADGDVVELD